MWKKKKMSRWASMVCVLAAVFICGFAAETKNNAFIKENAAETKLPKTLWMLASSGNAQMLSAVMQTETGGLVVVDGGWEADGDRLCSLLKKHGGHVMAWLLTHPHSDHVGALCDILKNRAGELQIDHIYYSFGDPQWYETASPEDPGMARQLLETFQTLPKGVADGNIGKGDVIQADGISIRVLNDRYELQSDPVNNSGIVYQAEMDGTKILFLGDMGYEGGKRLLEECGAKQLRSEIVQMAHHGQNGVGKEVYEAAAPKLCLWPTPAWFWDNNGGQGPGSGTWDTLETRRWMKELGVKIQACTKDGDIAVDPVTRSVRYIKWR